MVEDNRQKNLSSDLGRLDRQLVQLKVAYEQYFMGMERIAPLKLHEAVSQLVRRYSGVPIQNTGLKFRYDSLVARYNAYQGYWNRIMRQIEEGTYKRDQFKVKIHAHTAQGAGAKPNDAAQTGTPASAKDPIDLLYSTYVSARKNNQEKVEGITRDGLKKVITQQAAAIKKQYACKKVTFKVVTEGGKVKIKAVPKK